MGRFRQQPRCVARSRTTSKGPRRVPRACGPERVAIELVRYPRAQLNDWAQLIIAMDDIGWSSVGFENPNNRIEVQVRGSAHDAWQRIVRVVEPCRVSR